MRTRYFIFLSTILFVTGCTLHVPETISNNLNSSMKLVKRGSFSNTDLFDCFGFHITGPEIIPRSPFDGVCTSTDNFSGKGLGVFSRPFPRGGSYDVLVPPGRSRTIGVYGLEPQEHILGCTSDPTLGVGPLKASFLGSTITDVLRPFALSITIDYQFEPANVTCPMGAAIFTDTSIPTCTFDYPLFVAGLASPTYDPYDMAANFPEVTSTSLLEKLDLGPNTFEAKCSGAGLSKLHPILLRWRISAEALLAYRYGTFVFDGRAGGMGGPCTTPLGNVGTTGSGNELYAYKFNRGVGSTWELQDDPNPNLPTGSVTALQDWDPIVLADYVDTNQNIWFLLFATADSVGCSGFEIDSIELELDP